MRKKMITAFILAISASPAVFATPFTATSTIEGSVLVRGQKDGSDYSISVTPRDTLKYAYNAATKVFEITNGQGVIPLDIKVKSPTGFDRDFYQRFRLLASSKDGLISNGSSTFTLQPIWGGFQIGTTPVDLINSPVGGFENFFGETGNYIIKMSAAIIAVSGGSATINDMSDLEDGTYAGNIVVDLIAQWAWGR